MAEAALKIDTEHYVRVRRMTQPDLMDKAPMLCKRLRQTYTHLQDRQIYGFLQMCCNSNEYYFVRSDKAFSLAQQHREFLELRPMVREIFTFADLIEGNPEKWSDAEAFKEQENAFALSEAAHLYEGMLAWAQKFGAVELRLSLCTDVPLGDKGSSDQATQRAIFGKLGLKLFKAEEIFVALDPQAKIRKLGA